MKFFKFVTAVVLLATVMFNGIQTASASASASPSSSFKWKLSKLAASTTLTPSKVWSIHPSRRSTFNVSGSGCRKISNRIVVGATGRCRISVNVSATSRFKKFNRSKVFKVAVLKTPPITNAPAPSTTPSAPLPPAVSSDPVIPPVVALSCANGGVCAVGDTGPGGGVVFYVSSSFFITGAPCATACKYLEVAPTGWADGISSACATPGTSTTDPECGWSGNTSNSVVTSSGIGTGFSNTQNIIAQSSTVGHAGTLSRNYSGGGKSDWYLPSIDELHELCKFARGQQTGNTATPCSNSGSLSMSGISSSSFYFSSTESTSSLAHIIYFSNANPMTTGKNRPDGVVRAIRAF